MLTGWEAHEARDDMRACFWGGVAALTTIGVTQGIVALAHLITWLRP